MAGFALHTEYLGRWSSGIPLLQPWGAQILNLAAQGFQKSPGLSCQCSSCDKSTADLHFPSASVSRCKSSFAFFRESLLRFRQTRNISHMGFFSCLGEGVRKLQHNNSSHFLLFSVSNCCYPLHHKFYQIIIFFEAIHKVSSGTEVLDEKD